MDKTIKDWFHELPKLNLEKTNIKKCKARSKIIPATIAAILSILSIVQNTWIKGIIMVILNALSIATQGFYSNRLDYIIEEKKEKENEGYKKTISDLKNELEYEKQLSFVRDSLTRSLDDVLDNGSFKSFYTKFNEAIRTLFTQINENKCSDLAFHLYSYDKNTNTLSRLVVDHFSNQVKPAKKKEKINVEKCKNMFYCKLITGTVDDINPVYFDNHEEIINHLVANEAEAKHWNKYFAKRIETERVNYLIEIIGFSTEAFHSNDKQMILDKVTQPIESYLDIMGDLVVKAFEVANTAEGGAA